MAWEEGWTAGLSARVMEAGSGREVGSRWKPTEPPRWWVLIVGVLGIGGLASNTHWAYL